MNLECTDNEISVELAKEAFDRNPEQLYICEMKDGDAVLIDSPLMFKKLDEDPSNATITVGQLSLHQNDATDFIIAFNNGTLHFVFEDGRFILKEKSKKVKLAKYKFIANQQQIEPKENKHIRKRINKKVRYDSTPFKF